MRKTIFLLAASTVFAACGTTPGPAVMSCSGTTNGPANVVVSYRSDARFEIDMRLKTNVKPSSKFEVRLSPKGAISRDVKVKTVGVSGTLPDGTSTPFGWLDGEGTYNSLGGHKLVLCVPAGLPRDTTFKFDIIVDDIGTIDPRLDVTW